MQTKHHNIAKDLNGYRTLYLPEHPRAMHGETWGGYVYEHVVVAEDFLGRPLRSEEVVHHLDGNRANNRSGNLLVLEHSQHAKLHVWINSGAPGAETLRVEGMNSLKADFDIVEFCEVCGRTLQLKQKHTCSQACYGMLCRKVERPSKAQLQLDISSMSLVKVGKKYGVSDNAVRKWMKTYGIKKPTMSQASSTLEEGAETTGGVQPP